MTRGATGTGFISRFSHFLTTSSPWSRWILPWAVWASLVTATSGCEEDSDATTFSPDDQDGDGYTVAEGDCDDTDPDVYPRGEESTRGDGKDNDCDGEVDENDSWTDHDGDGYSRIDGDCDEQDPLVYPDAVEYMNGVDDDCDGTVDEFDPVVFGTDPQDATVLWPQDAWAAITREETDISVLFSMVFVPDLDDDGYDELAVSLFEDDGNGRVFLLYGGPNVLPPLEEDTPDWEEVADAVFLGVTAPNLNGTRIVTGDLDGDGHRDLLIGDFLHQRVAWFRGGGRFSGTYDMSKDATAVFLPVSSGAYSVGYGMAVPGDIDGDGIDDLVIGQPGFDEARGRVYIFRGGRTYSGLVDLEDADSILEGDEIGDLVGAQVAGIGDIDGDGLADFVVTSPLPAGTWTSSGIYIYGRIYLFYGSDDGFPASMRVEDAPASLFEDYWMSAVQFAHGDFDGDGFDDFVISEPWSRCLTIHYGGSTRLTGEHFIDEVAGTWICTEDDGDTIFGGSVDLGSDLNGDGYDDLVITTSSYFYIGLVDIGPFSIPFPQFGPGYVAIVPGRGDRLDDLPLHGPGTAMIRGEEGKLDFILPCAAGGDLNGDGIDDLAVGTEVHKNLPDGGMLISNVTWLYNGIAF